MLEIWHGGDWLKEIFGSSQFMVRLYVEVPDLVGFAYVHKISFPCVFHEYLYLLLCGFDGCSIIDIIMVISMIYDKI